MGPISMVGCSISVNVITKWIAMLREVQSIVSDLLTRDEALQRIEWSVSISPDQEPFASIYLEHMQRD